MSATGSCGWPWLLGQPLHRTWTFSSAESSKRLTDSSSMCSMRGTHSCKRKLSRVTRNRWLGPEQKNWANFTSSMRISSWQGSLQVSWWNLLKARWVLRHWCAGELITKTLPNHKTVQIQITPSSWTRWIKCLRVSEYVYRIALVTFKNWVTTNWPCKLQTENRKLW